MLSSDTESNSTKSVRKSSRFITPTVCMHGVVVVKLLPSFGDNFFIAVLMLCVLHCSN